MTDRSDAYADLAHALHRLRIAGRLRPGIIDAALSAHVRANLDRLTPDTAGVVARADVEAADQAADRIRGEADEVEQDIRDRLADAHRLAIGWPPGWAEPGSDERTSSARRLRDARVDEGEERRALVAAHDEGLSATTSRRRCQVVAVIGAIAGPAWLVLYLTGVITTAWTGGELAALAALWAAAVVVPLAMMTISGDVRGAANLVCVVSRNHNEAVYRLLAAESDYALRGGNPWNDLEAWPADQRA